MQHEPLSLGEFYEDEVLPALSAESIYTDPAHDWKKNGSRWRGGCPWHESKSGTSFVVTPESLKWFCAGCGEGGTPIQYLWKQKGGRGTPTGRDFVETLRELARMADVSFPERDLSPEEVGRARTKAARRSALETVCNYAQEVLWSPEGDSARAYLRDERGLSEDQQKDLGLGLYSSAFDVKGRLSKAGLNHEAQEAGLIWNALEGYIIFPWGDANGQPLTLYGRWPGKAPEGRPKTVALPGEGTKRSPLYYDRARRKHRDLVLVEGVLDAAVLQSQGETDVVSPCAASLSRLQVETLKRNRVRSVTLCLDPDSAGEAGTRSCVKSLSAAGIRSYVAPKLPDGLDPDEFVLRYSVKAWRAHLQRAISGGVHLGRKLLDNVDPTSPDVVKREAVDRTASYLSDELRDPWAKVDQEEVVREVAERTGWSDEALADVFEATERRSRQEAAEKALDSALREAQEGRGKKEDPIQLAEQLTNALGTLRTAILDEPSPFSVDRLLRESQDVTMGLPSGWSALDELDVSFPPGELAVFGARTGHGKTTVLVNLLVNWLREPGFEEAGRILFYSSEEPERRVFHRLLAVLACDLAAYEDCRWNTNQIRDYLMDPKSRGESYGWPNPQYLSQVQEVLRDLEDRLLIVYRPSWTVEDLASHAAREADRSPVAGVLVDYLQRIPPPAGSYDRRDIAVSEVARRLKRLSVELDVPVVTGAQINREAIPTEYGRKLSGLSYEDATEEIRKARPDLHNLREGGSEQEADLVLGLLNYAADYRSETGSDVPLPETTLLDVGILKSRYGRPGLWAPLAFEGRYGLLRDPREGEDLGQASKETKSRREAAKFRQDNLTERTLLRNQAKENQSRAAAAKVRQKELDLQTGGCRG